MANKQTFKPEEWTKILESTMLAGMAVSAAEPNGLLGSLKEAVARVAADTGLPRRQVYARALELSRERRD